MATRYEYYNAGDDNFVGCYSAQWLAQSFTPATAHKITSVKLKLYKHGSPGTLTVGIRATDGSGLPTDGDLCSGTIAGSGLTTSTNGAFYEITLGSGYILEVGRKYAIVCRLAGGDTVNYVGWRYDSSAATYPGGCVVKSINSGNFWTNWPTSDFMFEDWGEPPLAPTVTTQAVDSIGTTTATGHGNITDIGGVNCSKRGVCWNTTGNPTVADSKSEETDSFGIGAFTRTMAGLAPGQHYYVKAYAYNPGGYGYGTQVEFDTLVAPPTVTTQATDSIEQTTANPKGNVTDSGGENPTRYIDYDIDSGAPYAYSKDCGVGGVGVYNSNLTGLILGTRYYYRARAVNSGGTGTGTEMTFKTRAPHSFGFIIG